METQQNKILLLGLGNPGDKYVGSRHNLGFEVLDNLADELKIDFDISSKVADIVATQLNSREIILAKPKTFMNRSGYAARILMEKHEVSPENLISITDDYNLPLGSLRIRKSGSDGGHNGLFSIINELNTDNFPRIRLGIGPISEETEMNEFVLEKFTENEKKTVKNAVQLASKVLLYCCLHSVAEAMYKFNNKPA